MFLLKKIKEINFQILFFIFFFITIFVIEVVYLLPSQVGDDKYFINLASNICNSNSFTSETAPHAQRGNLNWQHHGFFGYYLMSKLNITCGLRGYFFFNFIIKVITFYLLLKISNNFEKQNKKVIISSSLLIISLQLYSQFRPETFAIFLIVFIFFVYIYKKYYLLGLFFSILFYSHPTGFYLTGLFFLLFEYKNLSKYFIKSSIGFILGLIILSFTYQFKFFDYLFAPLNNSGTYSTQFLNLESINYNYIFNKKAFFLLFNFIILYFYLLKKNFFLIIGIPFFIYFGPYSGYHEYNLFFLITILCVQIIYQHNRYNIYKYLFILFFSICILLPYFSRNFTTLLIHGNNLHKTQEFLTSNKINIKVFPEFVKYTNPKIELKNKTIPTNKLVKEFIFETYSVNGSRKNCKTLSGENPYIKIFGIKFFNSNSSYDIYICDIK